MSSSRTARTIALPILLCALCATSIATAGRRVLVLKSDGKAPIEIKVRIDTQVLQLAKTTSTTVESGEVTFADATAAVGCSGSEVQCRNDVLSTMSVDEIVSLTVTAMPNGDIRVAVHRIPKSGPIREAETTIPAGQSVDAKVAEGVGPLFGVKLKPVPESTSVTTVESERNPTAEPEGAPTGAFGGTERTESHANTENVREAPFEHADTRPSEQNQKVPSERRTSGRVIGGLVVGGTLMTTAVVLWLQASGTQADINGAAVNSPADFRRLQDLESKGDAYANFGNVFFIAGAVVAGVSGYFFWRDRMLPSGQASITPTVFDHGAGIALTVVEAAP